MGREGTEDTNKHIGMNDHLFSRLLFHGY